MIKGQIYIVDFALWLILISSLFLLIANLVDIINDQNQDFYSDIMATKTIYYSSELLGQQISNDYVIDNTKLNSFINSCNSDHEKTRKELGLLHTNNNFDYNLKIYDLSNATYNLSIDDVERFLKFECASEEYNGIINNRYYVNSEGDIMIVALEVYEVE